jgi:outer membrane protein assembly factor BamB
MLFYATIGGIEHNLIGILNKNGRYYVLDRGSINKGPIWKVQVARAGECPQCGAGNISPSAWDGKKLYVAGGATTINGKKCKGSLSSLNPATGALLWQVCLNDGPVLGAVSVVPGVAVVGEGNHLIVAATASGKTLFEYTFSSGFYAAASISHGVIYIGNTDGTLYAFGT